MYFFFLYNNSIDLNYIRVIEKHLYFEPSDKTRQFFLDFTTLERLDTAKKPSFCVPSSSDSSIRSFAQKFTNLKIFYLDLRQVMNFFSICLTKCREMTHKHYILFISEWSLIFFGRMNTISLDTKISLKRSNLFKTGIL